jgi:hypothetical protein
MKKSSLKNKLQKYFLRKEVQSRKTVKHSFVGFKEAKNIGIIYEADDAEISDRVHAYTAMLRSQNKRVHEMGFFNKRKVPADLNINSYSEYFSRKHLNWMGIPHMNELQKFINEPFDCLLDLSLNHPIPLLYISGLSKARFRVGRYREDAVPYFDFMIDVKDKSLDQLIEQADHYLKQF